MSGRWITQHQADELLTLTQDMAELITCLADDIDDGFRPPGSGGPTAASACERALLARFDALWQQIEGQLHGDSA
jgi:hypothetical protein